MVSAAILILVGALGGAIGYVACGLNKDSEQLIKIEDCESAELRALTKEVRYLTEHIGSFKNRFDMLDVDVLNTKNKLDVAERMISNSSGQLEDIKNDLEVVMEEVKGIKNIGGALNKAIIYFDFKIKDDKKELQALICRQANNLKNQIRNKKK